MKQKYSDHSGSASHASVIAANGARDEICITDPVSRQRIVLNTQTSAIRPAVVLRTPHQRRYG